ncbi:hypothetical protein ABIA32_006139 [Streptacidiphilus sp. MAP12-20]|uniref:hypothetical protein n=1 Tax=Streptacidiphilus sp. MAP12-20 TaxID=3156299 RepID=UPI0035195EFE
MTAQPFAQYLKSLHVNAGKPTYRSLEASTGYSKTVIGEALRGQRLPTWPVAEALVKALAPEELEAARRRWATAGGGSANTAAVPQWLVEVRSNVPDLISGRGLAAVVQLAASNPHAAVDDAWEVIRLAALHVTSKFYDDLPGDWSSNVIASFRRAEDDGRLPGGASAIASQVNSARISMRTPPYAVPTAEAVLQLVVLAYRLAYLANVTVHGEPMPKPPVTLDLDTVPLPAPGTYAAGGPAVQ